jgi:hypothetical protein
VERYRDRIRLEAGEEVVGSVAGNVPLCVIVAVAELEIIFFEALALLDRLYPGRLSPTILEMATLSTRRALKMLDPTATLQSFRQRVFAELTEEDVAALQETSVLGALGDFLRGVQRKEAQATGS